MILTSILAFGLTISVEGGNGCPSPELVQAQLASVLPHDLQGSKAHVARLEPAGEALTLDLRSASGELLASKRLDVSGDTCAARARVIAVILAAWELHLQGLSLGLPEPPPAAPAPPVGLPPKSAAPPRIAAPPAPKKDAAAPSRLALELGAGGLGSIAGGQLAFGGLVTAVLGPRQGLWILVADLEGLGNHSMPYGVGSANWYRFALGVGPGLRLRWRWLAVEAYGIASVSFLQIQGVGFTSDQGAGDVDVSVGLGLRVAATFSRWHPWVGVRVDDWLRGERVQVSGLPGPSPLPNVEVLPGLGCDLDLL